MRKASVALVLLLLLPAATASPPADVSARASCSPGLPGGSCSIGQDGTLRVECDDQCEVVAQGVATVTDGFPLKSVTTRLTVGFGNSAAGSCTSAGTGTTACPFDLAFPLFLAAGSCLPVTVTTTYTRTPFAGGSASRAFEVCLAADGEHVITAT